MTRFLIKAEERVTFIYDVIEADTIEEAIEMVEDGEAYDCMEVDSTSPKVTEYAIEGQMGWSKAPQS